MEYDALGRRKPDPEKVDYQRRRVYNAEKSVDKARKHRYLKFDEAVAMVRRIEGSRSWRMRYGRTRPLDVRRGRRGSGFAYYMAIGHVVSFVPGYITEGTVIHEMVHSVVRDHPSHGAKFCRELLWVVWRFLGPDAGWALRGGYKEQGVRWIAARDRPARKAAKAIDKSGITT